MPTRSTPSPSRFLSLTHKLRELGRLKPKAGDKEANEFEIIHTPDRPSRIVTPIEAPTEDECGDEIARWQRAAVARRINRMSARQEQGDTDTLDEAGYVNEDDDWYDWDGLRHAARLAYGGDTRHVGQDGQQTPQGATVSSMPTTHYASRTSGLATQVPAVPPGDQHARQPHQRQRSAPPDSIERSHAAARKSPPLSAVGPGATVLAIDMHNLSIRKEVPGLCIERYRRGYCPFCSKFFGNPLPLECPFQDCKRDLSVCLEYRPRRPQHQQQPQQQQAPPLLAERAFLSAQAQSSLHDNGQEREAYQPDRTPPTTPSSRTQTPTLTQSQPRGDGNPGSRTLSRRQAVDNLRKAPAHPQQPFGVPSPRAPQTNNNNITTKTRRKPVASLQPPTIPARSSSVSTPTGRRNSRIASPQLAADRGHRDAGRAARSPHPPDSRFRDTPASAAAAAAAASVSPTPTGRPDSRARRSNRSAVRSSKHLVVDDDIDFLAWKTPDELAKFERDMREKGNDADLFLDLIGEYVDEEDEPAGYI